MKWLVLALVSINAPRLRGWLRFDAALHGAIPPVHAAMGLGDMVIGACAIAIAMALLLRPWTPTIGKLVLFWSIAGAVDLTFALLNEILWPSRLPGFHDITGMIVLLTTNFATALIAGIALKPRDEVKRRH